MAELIEVEDISTITFKTVVEDPEDTSRWYVDDEKLTAVMTEWRYACDESKKEGKERPPLPAFVGECVLALSDAMGQRHNYVGYSYIEEMKGDAIINCTKYLHNFSPLAKNKKGKVSAFTYINFIITRAFNNRIEQEKEQQYLKYASYNIMGGRDAFGDETIESDDSEEGGISVGVLGDDFMNKAQEYENKYNLGKKIKVKKVVDADTFMFDIFAEDEMETA